MEVTSTNFKEALPKIEEVIKNCTFLAIDCEFSGLNVSHEVNAFDTPRQYYEKVRRNCRDFLVIQYGISAFRYDSDLEIFKHQSYNFYIFRRPINRNIPDQRFLCQTSSINFLTTQGFDFNKLFKSGISYLNINEENECRERIEEKKKLKSNQHNHESISIPEQMKPVIDDIMKQLADFLDSNNSELELPKCNAFTRRLIYQSYTQKFLNKITLQTKIKNNDQILVATKFKSFEELEEIGKKQVEEELLNLDNFIGFTKVLKIIIQSGKLVIGHNMCLDLLHTIDKFLSPLSDNYEEFKDCAHSLFQSVLDTKFMATSEEFKNIINSTILKDLLESVLKDPFKLPTVAIEEGGQSYVINDNKEHEAGFDAYITGLSFLSMWNYLGQSQGKSFKDTFQDFNLLKPYLNKIYLSMLRDNQYIHLGGQDSNPPRDHVFYLTFPKDWKLNNIIELFSPFGNVYVAWLNETSAYVGLSKKDQAVVALNTLSQSDTYRIMTYNNRQTMLNGLNILPSPAPSNRRKRTIENLSQNNKKMKIDESTKRNRFEAILEESESEGTPEKCPKKKTKKTFIESDAWD